MAKVKTGKKYPAVIRKKGCKVPLSIIALLRRCGGVYISKKPHTSFEEACKSISINEKKYPNNAVDTILSLEEKNDDYFIQSVLDIMADKSFLNSEWNPISNKRVSSWDNNICVCNNYSVDDLIL